MDDSQGYDKSPGAPAESVTSALSGNPSSKVPVRLPRAIAWLAWSLAAFLCVEAAFFRLPWYYRYVQSNSSTGIVESRLYWLQHVRPAQAREVLVVGDSRIAEGFSAPAAMAVARGTGLYFWNAGMASTTPRVWYYFLRDADPQRNRFPAIVLALDHYSDEDSFDSLPDRVLDLNLVIARLRYSDSLEFASSMKSRAVKQATLAGSLLKGSVIHRDLQAFLADIPKRLADAEAWRNHGLEYVNTYGGRDQNVEGLSVDWVSRAIHFPPGLDNERRDSIRVNVLTDHPSPTGDLTRYRMLWFRRILDLYRGSSTRFILIEMPRAPLPLLPNHYPTTSVDWMARQPNVTVIDASTFRDLESPETFFDGAHLNRKGRALFSPRLANLVADRLSR